MSKKLKYIVFLLPIITILLAFSVKQDQLEAKSLAKADGSVIMPTAFTPTPWLNGEAIRSGNLVFGVSKTIYEEYTPNVEYVDTIMGEEVNIRHLFDHRGGEPRYTLTGSPGLNLVETQDEYEEYGLDKVITGSVSFRKQEFLPGGKGLIATGGKLSADDKDAPLRDDLEVKVEMRADDTNSSVAHIYSITNNTEEPKVVYPYKSVDTQLAMNDYVPIHSLGQNKGLYIETPEFERDENGEIDETKPIENRYRLDYKMDVADKTKDEHNPEFYLAYQIGWTYQEMFGDVRGVNGSDKSVSDMAAREGVVVLNPPETNSNDMLDTTMHMSWGEVTIPAGETYKARYDVALKPLEALEVSKTVVNLTEQERNDGLNFVGDELEYTISMHSPKHGYKKLTMWDDLPVGLDAPTANPVITLADGSTKEADLADVLDPDHSENQIVGSKGRLTFTPEMLGHDLGKGKTITVKFKVKLNDKAAGKPISNLARVSGEGDTGQTFEQNIPVDKALEVEENGTVIVKSVYEVGGVIKDIAPAETLTGKLGDEITVTPKEFNGYKTEEKSKTVTYKGQEQTITFMYTENRFTIEQDVAKIDGSPAGNVSMEDVLKYTVTLTSNLKESSEPVYGDYKDFTIQSTIDTANLEEVKDFTLTNSAGTTVGSVSFDKDTGELVATVGASVSGTEDLILTYTAKVKEVYEVDIKAKATAGGDYTSGLVASPVTSNEVTSRVGAGTLVFDEAPLTLSFGGNEISNLKKEYSLAKMTGNILVTDYRKVGSSWTLSAQLTAEFTGENTQDVLTNVLNFRNGSEVTPIGTIKSQPIYEAKTTDDTRGKQINVSKDWVDDKEGLVLIVPGGVAKKDTYLGEITWTVGNTPENTP